MKIKKIFAAISAAAVLSLALSGTVACKKNGCDHVYTWTTVTPATCTAEGSEEGVCGICGDVQTRVQKINPDNHGYGEWEITKPTESAAGKATKTCSYNAEHKYEVTLPAITAEGTGYTSSDITIAPKPLEEGERTFTLADGQGEITYTVAVPARGIQTVEDAVEVGSSFKSLVRSCYGRTSNDINSHPVSEVYYEFGENYTHIIDDANRNERWYTLDGTGKPFGVRSDNARYNFEDGKPTTVIVQGSTPAKDTAANDGFMDGYGFAFYYTGSNQRYYGAEGLLAGLYQEAKASTNKDFYTDITTGSGTTVYKFGFGRYSSPYYSEIKAEFTLTAEYALKNLKVYAYDYDNTFEPRFEYNSEKGGYAPVEGADPSGVEYIEYTQTTLAELSADELADVPVSPYDEQTLRVKSFDVKVGNVQLTEDSPFTVNADSLREFEIANVENFAENIHSTAFDPISVYLRTAEGDSLVTVNTLASLGVLCNFSSGRVSLRSQITGEVTFALKTESGSFEKVIKLDVTPITPASISPQLYLYNSGSYSWTSTFSGVKVVKGQPLKFRATTEKAYEDNAVTPAVTTSNKTNAQFAQDSAGSAEWTFTASQTGNYTIELTSVRGARKCTFSVTVIEAPSVEQLFGGTNYKGTLEYPRGNVTLTCTVTNAAAGSGIISVTNARQETEVLSFTYVNGVLTTAHQSGAQNNFTVSLNDAYGLVLTHPSGFGSETESITVELA